MDLEKLEIVLEEVLILKEDGAFNKEDLLTFDNFWAAIDIINAYEEDWDDSKKEWMIYFKEAYLKLDTLH